MASNLLNSKQHLKILRSSLFCPGETFPCAIGARDFGESCSGITGSFVCHKCVWKGLDEGYHTGPGFSRAGMISFCVSLHGDFTWHCRNFWKCLALLTGLVQTMESHWPFNLVMIFIAFLLQHFCPLRYTPATLWPPPAVGPEAAPSSSCCFWTTRWTSTSRRTPGWSWQRQGTWPWSG